MQPMIPPKRFDIFPLTGGCSDGSGAFRFFFKQSTRRTDRDRRDLGPTDHELKICARDV